MEINFFTFFRYISFAKNFLILSDKGKFTIEVPSKREHFFKRVAKRMLYKSEK